MWYVDAYYVFLFWIQSQQGAIMAVGGSQPTVVASKDGRIGMKNQMQVKNLETVLLFGILH